MNRHCGMYSSLNRYSVQSKVTDLQKMRATPSEGEVGGGPNLTRPLTIAETWRQMVGVATNVIESTFQLLVCLKTANKIVFIM